MAQPFGRRVAIKSTRWDVTPSARRFDQNLVDQNLVTTAGGLAGLKMISDLMNNFQISLFEGPKRLINFAFPIMFDEHLLLPRPARRVREERDC